VSAVGYARSVKIFQRIGRAISRLSHSTAPVPAGGAPATAADLQQIEAVEQQEFPPEEQQDTESE
jgi:hypothetical protein